MHIFSVSVRRISMSTKEYEENVGYKFWPLMAVILRLFSCYTKTWEVT